MSRCGLGAVAILVAVYAAGCGGGSSQNGATTTVNITATRFFAQNITINAGNKVQWVNTDNTVHQVVSGTLLSTSNPVLVTPPISINENNSFTPPALEANYGDTIQWQNNRQQPFVLVIVDASNIVRATLTFQRSGQIIGFSGFPSAGYYTFQQQGNSAFIGSLVLFGTPKPDGAFQSQPLPPGGSFSTQFNTRGAFPYFDLDQNDPNRSFRTGSITVQ